MDSIEPPNLKINMNGIVNTDDMVTELVEEEGCETERENTTEDVDLEANFEGGNSSGEQD
jgi:hypothetical protein